MVDTEGVTLHGFGVERLAVHGMPGKQLIRMHGPPSLALEQNLRIVLPPLHLKQREGCNFFNYFPIVAIGHTPIIIV